MCFPVGEKIGQISNERKRKGSLAWADVAAASLLVPTSGKRRASRRG